MSIMDMAAPECILLGLLKAMAEAWLLSLADLTVAWQLPSHLAPQFLLSTSQCAVHVSELGHRTCSQIL